MKQKIVLVVSMLVGLIAFWMTNRYLSAERAELYKGAQKIEVVCAFTSLPAGTVLEAEDLGKVTVYRSAVGDNVFRPADVNRLIGKRLKYGLSKREPVWWSYVELPESGRYGLAPMVRSGMRAISIPIGGAAAVSGLVQPNNRVDILGTFTLPSRTDATQMEAVTLTLLQDVTVLATGQQLAKDDEFGFGARQSGYNMVSFEVTPREAELLVFAQHVRGQLHLALRNPEDVSFERDLPEVDFQHIESKLPELNLYRQQYIRHKKDL